MAAVWALRPNVSRNSSRSSSRLVTEGAPVPGVGGQAGVDDRRVVVVVEFDHHARASRPTAPERPSRPTPSDRRSSASRTTSAAAGAARPRRPRSTTSERTKPRSVIGSSSSGSIPPAPQRRARAASVAAAPPSTASPTTVRRRRAGRRRARRPASGQLQLVGHRDVVQLRGVEPEDLLLLLGGDRRVLAELLGDLEVDERSRSASAASTARSPRRTGCGPRRSSTAARR